MSIRNNAKRNKQLANRKQAIRGLTPLPEQQRFNYDLTSIKKQAYIRFNQQVYLVEAISHYQEYNWKLTKQKKYQSYELDLFSLNNAQRINIEWEKDDHIEAYITTNQLKLSQLSDENKVKIDHHDLEQIVEEEDNIYLNGKTFQYDDDWAAMYFRDNSNESGVRVRFYEFEANDGQCLTIEEWMDGSPKDSETEFEYEVFLSSELDPDSIEILSAGA